MRGFRALLVTLGLFSMLVAFIQFQHFFLLWTWNSIRIFYIGVRIRIRIIWQHILICQQEKEKKVFLVTVSFKELLFGLIGIGSSASDLVQQKQMILKIPSSSGFVIGHIFFSATLCHFFYFLPEAPDNTGFGAQAPPLYFFLTKINSLVSLDKYLIKKNARNHQQ